MRDSSIAAALWSSFTAVDDSFSKRLAEVDDSISKCLADSDLNWECRITDSEIRQTSLIAEVEQRQDVRVNNIMQTMGTLENWRQESEGTVDDLKLKVDKLTKYWDRSFLDNATASTGLISPFPLQLEKTAMRSSAGNMAAWPTGATSNGFHGWMALGKILPNSIPRPMGGGRGQLLLSPKKREKSSTP